MCRIAVRRFLMLLNVMLVLMLVGCGGATPLANGDLKTGLKGKANSEKKFSINISEYTNVLMVQAAGSESVSLQIRNASDQLVSVCPEPSLCLATSLLAGKYMVKLVGLAAYENVSLSAAWASSSQSTLKNNVLRALPAGNTNSVGLDSFYMLGGDLPVKIQLSGADLAKISVDVVNENGESVFVCAQAAECVVTGLNEGAYFLRHSALDSFTDISAKIAWGGADSATLQNGVPLTNISGTRDSVVWERFYIPANVDAFMVQGSQADYGYSVEVYDSEGQQVASCSGGYACSYANPAEGLYSVAIRFYENVSGLSVVAAWAGSNVATISNGVPKSGLSGQLRQALVQSLYLSEGIENFALHLSGLDRGFLEVLDKDGRAIENCSSYDPCVLRNPAPGAYFARVWFDENKSNVSLSAVWAGRSISTLQNGVPLTGISGQVGQRIMHSLYIPAGVEQLAVQLSGLDRGMAEIIDGDGRFVSGCSYSNPCVMRNPIPGAYFVRVWFDENKSNVSLSAVWAGPAVSTLQNGIPRTGLSGQVGQRIMHSLYIPAGVEQLAVQLSGLDRGMAEIIDGDGRFVSGCSYSNPCVMRNPIPGAYFVRVWFDENKSNVSLSAAWAGPTISTLQNGVPLTGLSAQVGQRIMHSLYIPEGVERLAVQLSGLDRGMAEILDSDGRSVSGCSYSNPCVMRNPIPGAYFVRVWFDENKSNVSLSAAWAGPTISTLQNGVPLNGLSGQAGQQVLQSLYIPEGVGQLSVQLAGLEHGFAEIMYGDGWPMASCSINNPCVLQNPMPGAYFVRLRFDAAQSNVGVLASW